MSRPVRSVAIVGRDVAAWLTALGLQRALGRQGVVVTVVELPSALRSVDVVVALPALEGLHRLLGLDESEVLAACAGVYALGQQFANWSRSRPPFVHAYDSQGAPLRQVDFLQHWLKARSEGLDVALEDFSLGAVAAKQGRFIVHNDATDSFSKARCGYHLDASTYVRFLRQKAVQAGVQRVAGTLDRVARTSQGVASVSLSGGATVAADLFVDASGVESVLTGKALEVSFESWSAWFGCDRILAASGPRLTPLPAMSRIAAFTAGWTGMFPLQDRTPVISVYDSRRISDDEMLRNTAVLTGMRLGDAVVSPFAAGCRATPWTDNCIAIGEAAAVLDPLDAAPLHMIHIGLSHLISLFPVDADQPLEAQPYNDAVLGHARNLRDFQIAHYRLNERLDEPFWDAAREAEPPPGLAYKLDLFAARGAVALYEDETFQEENWSSILVGHGLIPRAHDPQADAVPREEQIQSFKRMLGFIAGEVREMPSIEAQLELFAPMPSSSPF
jgi:tryptophan halogenase